VELQGLCARGAGEEAPVLPVEEACGTPICRHQPPQAVHAVDLWAQGAGSCQL